MGTEYQETQTVVYLGNRQAIETIDGGQGIDARRQLFGKQCTTVKIPGGTKLLDAARDITHPQGVWAAHSNADAPAWVASDNAILANLLAAHWGCEVREPDPDHEASGGPGDHPGDHSEEA